MPQWDWGYDEALKPSGLRGDGYPRADGLKPFVGQPDALPEVSGGLVRLKGRVPGG